jgi:hypothetical protein
MEKPRKLMEADMAGARRLAIWLAFLIALVTAMSSAMAEDHPRIQQDIDHLLEICAAHPEFHASSIDVYDPRVAKPFEKDFYETARALHARPRSLDVIATLRVAADAATATCLDNITNTWPG